MKIKITNTDKLYKKATFDFKPNAINVLIGPNGTGKTQLLKRMEAKFKKDDTLFVSYSNMTNGRNNATQRFIDSGNIEALVGSVFRSEGQEMYSNFANVFLRNLRSAMVKEQRQDTPRETLWLLIDAMDSGFDIPHNREIIDLFSLILNMEKSKSPFLKDIYIVVTSNSYEYVKDREVLDVLTGKWMSFTDYDSFANHIIETKKKIDKRDEERD